MRLLILFLTGILATTSFAAEDADILQCFGCVNPRDIANDAVRSRHVADGAVSTSRIADSAVTGEKLADGVVDYNKLAQDVRDLIDLSLSQRRMKLIDSTGAYVGDVADVYLYDSDAYSDADRVLAWVDIAEEAVLIQVRQGVITAGRDKKIWFATEDCSGAPYFEPLENGDALINWESFAVTSDGKVWKVLPDTTGTRYVRSASYPELGSCLGGQGNQATNLAVEIGDLSGFLKPFKVVYE